jgi:hypothetical protein
MGNIGGKSVSTGQDILTRLGRKQAMATKTAKKPEIKGVSPKRPASAAPKAKASKSSAAPKAPKAMEPKSPKFNAETMEAIRDTQARENLIRSKSLESLFEDLDI